MTSVFLDGVCLDCTSAYIKPFCKKNNKTTTTSKQQTTALGLKIFTNCSIYFLKTSCGIAAVLWYLCVCVCVILSLSLPSLAFSLDVFGEADLVRKISLIFEALHGFSEHAQCVPLSNSGNRWWSIGVIPSIACVSVQSTYSWLWGELTLLLFLYYFISLRFVTAAYLPVFQKVNLLRSLSTRVKFCWVSTEVKLEAGPLAFLPSLQRRREKTSWSSFFPLCF